MAEACVLCEIVAGRLPASITYEDDRALGLLDICPVTPGHMLVIPKIHAAYVADMDEEAGTHLFEISMRMAAALRASGLHCEGVNWFLAGGEAAGQEVFHVHLHIFARFRGDGFRLVMDRSTPAREELNAIAAKIRTGHASFKKQL